MEAAMETATVEAATVETAKRRTKPNPRRRYLGHALLHRAATTLQCVAQFPLLSSDHLA